VSILAAPTGEPWLEAAASGWQRLLVDHANCEKKAASSALALIFAYPEDGALCAALARLAREELRHYEQVAALMRRLQVPFERQQPGRYAAGLRAALRSHEPARKFDLLLAGALIEARSAERFALLAPRLADPLAGFYGQLSESESRHFELYLRLAAAACPAEDAQDWQARLHALAAVEAALITAPDPVLRFHSGVPLAAALPG
jgi:tRNA 2-(methylsulfanyl)-N6-isopentenyladenosine37 hydroxylase